MHRSKKYNHLIYYMFSSKNTSHYLFAFGAIAVISIIGMYSKQSFQTNDEYDLIKKYLLNESPLYGFNKPKLWIHSKYEVNSRHWKSFQSRNSTDLNQPYLHLTIKTIINHCGNDFNICLIDDDTFSRLIPSWDIDLKNVAKPMRSQYREIGMLQLIYYYGGMVVPNSFLCMKNLKPLYLEGIAGEKPFVCERVNHTLNLAENKSKPLFLPSVYFMGAKKNDETVKELVEYLKRRSQTPHFSKEAHFTGDTSQWCAAAVRSQQMNLVDGKEIGVKSQKNKPFVLEELMEEAHLDLSPAAYGIYIPAKEILRRHKYQWFAVLPAEDVFKTNAIIAKYLMASVVDSSSEYTRSSEIRSVISI
jgi:hypothetical protein